MTRPENLKVGDMFRVIKESSFELGEIISLKKDDGTNSPYFWNADKSDVLFAYWSDLEPHIKTIRDAQVGDVVIGKGSGYEYMVLERGQNTVVLSQANDFREARGTYHFDQLEERYTLKAE